MPDSAHETEMVGLERSTAHSVPPTLASEDAVAARSTRTRQRLIIAATVASVLSILPIVYAHRASPRTLVSAHGLLHTAIAQRFQSASALPGRPENPFFAGEALPYYWFFHYLAARIGDMAAIHPLYAFELMVLAAVCVLWFTAVAMGCRLYGGVAPGVAIGFLALAGANPFGAVILLVKLAVRGASVLRDSPDYLWGIAHPILGVARYNDPYVVYGPLLNFFFNISSRPIALALLLLVCLSLATWLQSGRRRAWIWLTLSSAACTAFSFLIGVTAGLALIGGLAVAWGLSAIVGLGGASTGNRTTERTIRAAAALLLGMVLASPTYYYFFLGTEDQSVHLHPRLWVIQGIALSASVVAAMAVVGVLRAKGVRQQFLLATAAGGYALLVGSAIVELPASNDSNLFHAAIFLLSIPAAGCLVPAARWSRVPRLLSWGMLLLLFLPTTCIVAYAYLNRAAIALEINGGQLYRLPRESALAQLYTWVRGNTPSDAVFILDPTNMVAAGGNMPEFPAMTGRVLFTADKTNYIVVPHADATLRTNLALHLLAGEAANEQETAYLKTLQRPIYLVVTDSKDRAALRSLENRYGTASFHDSDVAVFQLR